MAVHLRSSQALTLWREVTERMVAGSEREGRDLTQRQLAILLTVYLEPPPHTVRALAARLNVTKPVITRALDTMGEAGLIDRYRDPEDGRNVLIKRTLGGSLFCEKLSDAIITRAKALPA
ncbi:MAG: MarR family transcriptional regulator [Rhizobiaceae bacterium]|nr:MarR family transcriptional regulator [Rhizobiaceae bacterium]